MKILQINATYGKGSTGYIVRDLDSLINSRGDNGYVAYSTKATNQPANSYVIGDTFDHKIHALKSRIFGKQAYYSARSTKRLLKYIDCIKPDIVHLHNLHNNYINLTILLKYLSENNISVVVTMHDCWFFTGGCFHFANIRCERWKNECGNCPKRLLDTKAYLGDKSKNILNDRIKSFVGLTNITFVGVSDWIVSQFNQSRLSNHKSMAIHNGIDVKIFNPQIDNVRGKYGITKSHVILGAANKWLDPINAPLIKCVVEKFKDTCDILIFGCNQTTKLPFDNVRSIGYIRNQSEMASIYRMADVFLNCSHEDSLPTVNLECQAVGTPVVAFSNTGITETVAPVFSRIVTTDNIAAAIESTAQVLEDKPLLDRDILHEWIAENFDKNVNYNKYMELYRSIVQ